VSHGSGELEGLLRGLQTGVRHIDVGRCHFARVSRKARAHVQARDTEASHDGSRRCIRGSRPRDNQMGRPPAKWRPCARDPFRRQTVGAASRCTLASTTRQNRNVGRERRAIGRTAPRPDKQRISRAPQAAAIDPSFRPSQLAICVADCVRGRQSRSAQRALRVGSTEIEMDVLLPTSSRWPAGESRACAATGATKNGYRKRERVGRECEGRGALL
jgi:hypothetical protein